RKRLDWYLARGLARSVDEKTIQLTFKAKGLARSSEAWHIQDRVNQCVVCGIGQEDRGLIRQHVVPSVYRKEMPEELKSRNDHDLLPICTLCHDAYERHAHAFKVHLARMYQAPLEGLGWIIRPHLRPVIKAARALSSPHVTNIPMEKQDELRRVIMGWWDTSFQGQSHPWEGILEKAMALEDRVRGPLFSTHAEVIIRYLSREEIKGADGAVRWPDLEEFIREWRAHFLCHAQPRHLPSTWGINGNIY
ncbi:MAG: hypothetical protein DHS80DRAFT_19010, partial [Piptocephalis tieghemiana]